MPKVFLLSILIVIAQVASAEDTPLSARIACRVKSSPESGPAVQIPGNTCVVAKTKKNLIPAEIAGNGNSNGDEFILKLTTELVSAKLALTATGSLSYSVESSEGESTMAVIPGSSLASFSGAGLMFYLSSKAQINGIAVGSYYLSCFQIPAGFQNPKGCTEQ